MIDVITGQHELLTRKVGADILDALLDAMREEIRTAGNLKVAGFGTFMVRSRAARRGVDPRTQEPIQINATKTVAFRPAKVLKESL